MHHATVHCSTLRASSLRLKPTSGWPPSTLQCSGELLELHARVGFDVAVATDGSADEAEAAQGPGEGERAGAWATWDGRQARGGALPAGSDNYMAELWAIERTLACVGSGQRVLIMCDCTGAIEAVEDAWRRGELGAEGGMAKRRGRRLIEAITRHRVRLAAAGDDGGRRGGCWLMWVPAHSGGVTPNAYARTGCARTRCRPREGTAGGGGRWRTGRWRS